MRSYAKPFWVYPSENENKMDDFLCKVEITLLCIVIYNFKPQGMIIHRYVEWKKVKQSVHSVLYLKYFAHCS